MKTIIIITIFMLITIISCTMLSEKITNSYTSQEISEIYIKKANRKMSKLKISNEIKQQVDTIIKEYCIYNYKILQVYSEKQKNIENMVDSVDIIEKITYQKLSQILKPVELKKVTKAIHLDYKEKNTNK